MRSLSAFNLSHVLRARVSVTTPAVSDPPTVVPGEARSLGIFRLRCPLWVTVTVFALFWTVFPCPLWAQGIMTRVSVGPGGAQANGPSAVVAISANGRFVAFNSDATNLVANDTNGVSDVFVHDRETGVTTRVSVASDGAQGDKASSGGAISADGRFVAFGSDATHLVAGDDNGVADVFVHDRQTGTTTRVSIDSAGIAGNGRSYRPVLSGDGRFVAFVSDATNLVDGDTNAAADIFVHDRETGTTTRVSVDSQGVQGNGASSNPAISADGRTVAFDSDANSLGDGGGYRYVFVHDRETGSTTQVSSYATNSAVAALSADGRFVAFTSSDLFDWDVNLLNDVYTHDRQTGVTTLISGAYESRESDQPTISGDGRFVSFVSTDGHWEYDANLDWWFFVGDSSQLFVCDLQFASNPSPVPGSSGTISADGRFVALSSWAENLVPGDTNGTWDVFVRDGSALGKAHPASGTAAQPLSISLSWLSPWVPDIGDTTYEYCYDTIDNGVCDTAWTSNAAGVVTISGLLPGTTYFWQVRKGTTYADGGQWWSFTTAPRPGVFGKSSPADGAVQQPVSLTLTWNESPGATSYWYAYFVAHNDGTCNVNSSVIWPWDGQGFLPAATTTLSVNLHPGTTYCWQVWAETASGSVGADNETQWTFTTALAPPEPFEKLTPSQNATLNDASFWLTWNRSWAATRYEYCYDTVNNDVCDGTWIPTAGVGYVSAAVSGLAPSTVYYWQVRAINALGTTYANGGAWWSFTTAPVVPGTRVISVTGDLAFGDLTVGTSATRTVTVSNGGNSTLTLSGITYPPGFSGVWTGTIPAGGSQTVVVTFAPTAVTGYGGAVVVAGDQTGGTNTIAVSGTGRAASRSVMDFDGDGAPDLVWRNRTTGEIVFWLMNGLSKRSEVRIAGPTDRRWRVVAVADFDGDGDPDLLLRHATSGENQVWYMNGTTHAGSAPLPAVADPAWQIAAAGDFNGDGDPDLLWHNGATGDVVVWYLHGAAYADFAWVMQGADPKWMIAGAADFNHDGKPDLVWRDKVSGQTTVWHLDGVTTVGYSGLQSLDAGWMVAQMVDYSGDGMADLLWRNSETGENQLWRMDGGTRLAIEQLPAMTDVDYETIGAEAGRIRDAVCDFNADGKPDILWHNDATGENHIWYMAGSKGDGQLADLSIDTEPDLNWKTMAAADFNGDGLPDIVWRNAVTGANRIWVMTGRTHTSTIVLPMIADANWKIVGAGDFNKDGYSDLAWRNYATGQNVIWFLWNGQYIGWTAPPAITDAAWKIVAVGDFNGDGWPDLFWRNQTTGVNIAWFLVNGVYQGWGQPPTIPDPAWRIVGAADYNGDGKADLLWRNATTGQNLIWYLRDGAYLDWAPLPSLDIEWKTGVGQ